MTFQPEEQWIPTKKKQKKQQIDHSKNILEVGKMIITYTL